MRLLHKICFYILLACTQLVFSQSTLVNKQVHAEFLQQVGVLKQSKQLSSFVARAKEVQVSESGIDSIIYAKLLQDHLISELINDNGNTNNTLLMNFGYKKYDKQSLIANYRNTVSTVLSKDQFAFIYKELLDPQIAREVEQVFSNLEKEYNIQKPQHIKVLKKWIQQYVSRAVIEQEYLAYDRKMAKVAYDQIIIEGEVKYAEVLLKMEVPLLDSTSVVGTKKTKAQLFKEKAMSVGIPNYSIAKIIEASNDRDAKIKAIELLGKSEDKDIYIIESGNNSKNAVKNEFKKTLSKILSIQQFQKLFIDQLQPEIDAQTRERVWKINKVYTLTEAQQQEIFTATEDFITKYVVLSHYYSFDKTLKKQKLKVVKFKYDAEYKRKIKQYTTN